MMSPRRVLIYAMNFWPEKVGIGKMSSELAHYLANAGWNVTVITSLPHQPNWEIHQNRRQILIRRGMGGYRNQAVTPLCTKSTKSGANASLEAGLE